MTTKKHQMAHAAKNPGNIYLGNTRTSALDQLESARSLTDKRALLTWIIFVTERFGPISESMDAKRVSIRLIRERLAVSSPRRKIPGPEAHSWELFLMREELSEKRRRQEPAFIAHAIVNSHSDSSLHELFSSLRREDAPYDSVVSGMLQATNVLVKNGLAKIASSAVPIAEKEGFRIPPKELQLTSLLGINSLIESRRLFEASVACTQMELSRESITSLSGNVRQKLFEALGMKGTGIGERAKDKETVFYFLPENALQLKHILDIFGLKREPWMDTSSPIRK